MKKQTAVIPLEYATNDWNGNINTKTVTDFEVKIEGANEWIDAKEAIITFGKSFIYRVKI